MGSTSTAPGVDIVPTQQTDTVLIATAVLLALAWLAVLLRISVRTLLINAFGRDDFALLVTTVSTRRKDSRHPRLILAQVTYSAMCAFLFTTYAVAATVASTGQLRPKDMVSLQVVGILEGLHK